MIKIAHVEEVKQLQHIPQEVIAIFEEIVSILDREYGSERLVDEGNGGYVLIIESVNELDEPKDI
jgi:hypothetical protein